MLSLPFPALLRLSSRTGGLAAVALTACLSSCTSTSPKIEGLPSNLPAIPLYGQARTPPHSMRHGDYPFDSNGNYVTSWAAEGGASAGPSDYRSTRHHDDDPPPRRSTSTAASAKTKRSVDDSPPKKVASSSSNRKSSPATTKKETSSPPAKKPAASTGGSSTKHVVKSSDTLFGLAKKYGTTVAKIKAANGLSSDVLRDGRTLTIPK